MWISEVFHYAKQVKSSRMAPPLFNAVVRINLELAFPRLNPIPKLNSLHTFQLLPYGCLYFLVYDLVVFNLNTLGFLRAGIGYLHCSADSESPKHIVGTQCMFTECSKHKHNLIFEVAKMQMWLHSTWAWILGALGDGTDTFCTASTQKKVNSLVPIF